MSDVIAIRAVGTQRPLFVIHEDAGEHGWPLHLAHHIDQDMPIYGLPGVPAGQPPLRTLEGLAACLTQSIVNIQSAGPYRLVGWSMCGLLAYEVAMQLIGRDQAVEFLGIVDARCTERPAPDGEGDQTGAQRMCRRAIADYIVHPLPIPVHLFTARDELPVAKGSSPLRLLTGSRCSLPRRGVRIIETCSRRPFMTGPHVSECGALLSKALAAAAREQPELPESQYQAVIAVQTAGPGKVPIFCVPGAGDNVIGFMDLVHALSREWSIHGVQPRGVEGVLVPHSTVEAAACAYLKAIDAVHPRGPVHLIGHSFGGWIVLEIALQMQTSGRPVASLTIIDSEVPGEVTFSRAEHTSLEVMTALIEAMELSAGRSLGIDAGLFARRNRTEQIRMLHAAAQGAGLLPRHSKPEVLVGPSRTFGTALRTPYVPTAVYSGPLRLVLARDPHIDEQGNRRMHEDTVRGWKTWASTVTCWYSAGNHFTALRAPHVNALMDWWHSQ